jgi:hypothetical protein
MLTSSSIGTTEILEEQHGKAGTARGAHQAALLRQQLDDDCRRGQGQAQADDDGCGSLAAEQGSDGANRDRREGVLQAAQAEHQTAHGQQPLEGQLKADQEQQEHHAQLGDGRDVLGVRYADPLQARPDMLEGADAQRSEHRASHQKRQHRIDAPAMHRRHDHACGAEHQQGIAVGEQGSSRPSGPLGRSKH